jgi:hypothetical protein
MPTLYPAHASSLRRGRFCEAGRSYLVTTVIEQRHPVFRDLLSARLLITQMRSCQLDGLVDSELVKKSSAVARASPGVRGKARCVKSGGV